MQTKLNLSESAPLRIALAIDMNDDSNLFSQAAMLTQILSSQTNCEIFPVIIQNKSEGNPEDLAFLHQRIQTMLQSYDIQNLHTPSILFCDGDSLDDYLQSMEDYLSVSDPHFLVLGTHGKSGLRRLFSGSFTEALVMRSSVPLLVVNRHYEPKSNLGEVIFATDLRHNDSVALEKLLPLVSALKNTLVLYNKIGYVAGLRAQEISNDPYQKKQLKSDAAKREEKLMQYGDRLERSGVPFRIDIDESAGLPSEVLLRKSAAKPGSVTAVISKRGPIAASIEGSVTRHLLRESSSPVWVVRNQAQ